MLNEHIHTSDGTDLLHRVAGLGTEKLIEAQRRSICQSEDTQFTLVLQHGQCCQATCKSTSCTFNILKDAP